MPETGIAAIGRIARVNGVALNTAAEPVTEEELRRRACTELLRQEAQRAGLLPPNDAPGADGVVGEAAAAAIEKLIAQRVAVPEPDDDACRRYYAAHEKEYRTGERARVRHVLFAVTTGVHLAALRRQAESVLLALRCEPAGSDAFGRAARAFSNCPSGAHDGALGWLAAGDCAPEFAAAVFGGSEVGVLPRLVHTRYGLHVVEVLQRDPGAAQPFEAVRAAVAMALRRHGFVTALRRHLGALADVAELEGVDLDAPS